jgi:hypothetical protein
MSDINELKLSETQMKLLNDIDLKEVTECQIEIRNLDTIALTITGLFFTILSFIAVNVKTQSDYDIPLTMYCVFSSAFLFFSMATFNNKRYYFCVRANRAIGRLKIRNKFGRSEFPDDLYESFSSDPKNKNNSIVNFLPQILSFPYVLLAFYIIKRANT